jgi:polar amino acid transport system ATP-binding protein
VLSSVVVVSLPREKSFKVSETPDNDIILSVKDLVKRYKGSEQPVLNGVSVDVRRGETVVVLGPSGCGKSTLLRCIVGLEDIQGGEVVLNGKVISGSARTSALRQRIGMVFQSYDLFPNKTVLGNVTLAPLVVQGREKEEVNAQAEQLLQRVGLWDKRDVYPSTLSGGQKQRIAIVRALMTNPEVMLFDEVTAALDPEMVHEVLQVILELSDQGMTMVIVTHEMGFARAIADQVVLLDGGGVVECSHDPESFFEMPSTQRAKDFLGTFEFRREKRAECT